MKKDYVVVGKFSQVNIDEVISQDDRGNFKIDKKKLKKIVAGALALAIMATISDLSLAHSAFAATTGNAVPAMVGTPPVSSAKPILDYIDWLIRLIRWILSSVSGLICTFAGWKWATTIDGNGQEAAKKILKNAFVGGLVCWCGTTIAHVFIDKMNQLLL